MELYNIDLDSAGCTAIVPNIISNLGLSIVDLVTAYLKNSGLIISGLLGSLESIRLKTRHGCCASRSFLVLK